MVSHGSHTNHGFLILVIQVTNVGSAIESVTFFNMASLLQIKGTLMQI